MSCPEQDAERLNTYALVAYIPAPLGPFLDDLRRHLVPGCRPHAHVTVLPPRSIAGAQSDAIREVQELAHEFSPFWIEIGPVEIFEESNVVYLEIASGVDQLKTMHQAMDVGSLAFKERFEYHPHVTLAQELTADQTKQLAEAARQRWAAFPHSRRFYVDTLTFVQNTVGNIWIDLKDCHLAPVPSVR